MLGKDHAALVECADQLLRWRWHHDDQLLLDAEFELEVCYELFSFDLKERGELEHFDRLPQDAQLDLFFKHLRKPPTGEVDPSSLDEVPECDWTLVWIKYLANILRAIDGACDGMKQEIDLVSAQLRWAILTSDRNRRSH